MVGRLIDEDEGAGSGVGGVARRVYRLLHGKGQVADVVGTQGIGARHFGQGRHVPDVADAPDFCSRGLGCVFEQVTAPLIQRLLVKPADGCLNVFARYGGVMAADDGIPARDVEVAVEGEGGNFARLHPFTLALRGV